MTDTIILFASAGVLAGVMALAIWGMIRRLREDSSLSPPGLLARLIARRNIGPQTLDRPGVLAETANAIETCKRCQHVAACRTWLAENSDENPPPFCANAAYLASLDAESAPSPRTRL